MLLVLNTNSPISRSIAHDYALKRNVTNTVLIHCQDSALNADDETIPFTDYKKSIEHPIRDYLADHPEIDFIVTTKGVPIRITDAPTGESFGGKPEVSLDSYLAALDYDQLSDAVKIRINAPSGSATGLAWINRYWNSKEPFSHAKFGGYLVTRLDGYTENDAKALVTRSLAAEQGLAQDGKVLLDVQPDFGVGDESNQPIPLHGTLIEHESPWGDYNADMVRARDILQANHVQVELDMTPTFVGDRKNLLGYCSWGSNDSHYGAEAYQSLFFAPGAICDTAVSTSARTFLPTSDGQSLIADLIAHGVTGVQGYTDEPLLQSVASPTLLFKHYTSGYSLAESFYAASNFVGWETVVIGDPLCCPYHTHSN